MRRLEGTDAKAVVQTFMQFVSETNPGLPETLDSDLLQRMVFLNRTTMVERMEEIHQFSKDIVQLAGIEAPAYVGVHGFEHWPLGNEWEPYETLRKELRQSPLFGPPSVFIFEDQETDALHATLSILNMFFRDFFIYWNDFENLYGQSHSGECYLLARSQIEQRKWFKGLSMKPFNSIA